MKTDTTIDRERATVSYALHVIPGPVYHLGKLTVKKLTAEQEGRVRALLGMNPGDLYLEAAITQLYGKVKGEPLLQGFSFSYSPVRNKDAGLMDLTLEFFKEGEDASVTVQ